MCMYKYLSIYNRITLPYSRNQNNIVNQLYFNKIHLKINIIHIPTRHILGWQICSPKQANTIRTIKTISLCPFLLWSAVLLQVPSLGEKSCNKAGSSMQLFPSVTIFLTFLNHHIEGKLFTLLK